MRTFHRRACIAMLGALAAGSLSLGVPPTVRGQSPCSCSGGQALLVYGDSVSTGTGASDSAHGYEQIIATTLGLTLDNEASSGSEAAQQNQSIQATALSPTGGMAVWLTGYNDMRHYGLDATHLASFGAQVAAGLARFRPATRVFVGNCLTMTTAGYALQSPTYSNGSDAAVALYNGEITRQVNAAKATGKTVYLVDVSSVYNPNTQVSGDGTHPGDTGHAALAATFLAAIRAAM